MIDSPSETRPGPVPAPVARVASGSPLTGLEKRLFDEGYAFDFFQAVRILQRRPGGLPVGHVGPPSAEAVRFRTHVSLSFPPSAIHELIPAAADRPQPIMVEAFLGLIGPNGVLPRHYTELAFRLERDRTERNPERHALRDWFDLFDHRLVSLFYRAWEKYRFFIPFERQPPGRGEPDLFTACLFSLVGLGAPSLRNRLRVSIASPAADGEIREQRLVRIEDFGLLRYAGLLANQCRSAVGLQAVIQDFFQLPVEVLQYQGQWLQIEPANRSRLEDQGNNQLGLSTVIGDRVWDVQSKFRLRIGPLGYDQFLELLPDREPGPRRKTLFLMIQLVRLYVGPELDFDHQLVLRRSEAPECQLDGESSFGSRLGWNTWLHGQLLDRDPDDAVFEGNEVITIH